MTLFHDITGKGKVPMSAEEEIDIRAEWAANENPVISAEKINSEIDELLAYTDWTQIIDADLTNAEKAQWNGYRAALRAMDRTPRSRDLGFPVPPSGTERNGR